MLLKLSSLRALCRGGVVDVLRCELKVWNNVPLSGEGGSSRLQSEVCLMRTKNCVFWLFLSSFLSLWDIGSVGNGDGSAQAVCPRVRS